MKEIKIGRINKVYHMDEKIIKMNDNKDIIKAEYNALQLLKEKNILCPEIYKISDNEIVMEYVDDLPHTNRRELIVDALKKLHSNKNNQCGNTFDTFVGNMKVDNSFEKSWMTFFSKRWLHMLKYINDKDDEFEEVYWLGVRVYDKISEILNFDVEPSLLHGDANPNNFLINANNEVVIIDPGCFYGDPKYDYACFTLWYDNILDDVIKEDTVMLLYYSFILLSVYNLLGTKSRLKKAVKYMKMILEKYNLLYPSIICDIKIDYNVIIVQGGSYNPVHKNHVNNMIVANNYFKDNNKNVKCIFSLASDRRVKQKCKNGISLKNRRLMLEKMLLQSELKNVSIDMSGLWGDDIIVHYRNLFCKGNTKIYICCGTDTIDYHFAYFKIQPELFLVVKRNKYKIVLNDEKILYLDNSGEITMSSTKIREDVEKHKSFMNDDVYEMYINM